MKIYIAAPYTKGDLMMNLRKVLDVADEIAKLGHTPFIPHLTAFWHMVHPHDIEFWYEYDNEWLDACDALFRIPGESTGADNEVKRAIQTAMPVYHMLSEIPVIKM